MIRSLRPAVLALVLTFALLPLTWIGGAATPAHANAPSTGELRVELADISPAVAGPGEDVTVSGTVRNVSAEPFEDLVVLVRAAPRDLGGRDALESWENGSDTGDAGLVRATAHLQGELAPGEERPFTAVLDDGALTPDLALGTLPLTLHVLPGSDFDGPTGEFSDENEPVPPWDPTANILPRGEQRGLLPWADPEADVEPLRTSWLVPLTVPADLDLFSLDPAEQDAAWVAALGPGSPADAWLREATDLPVTYAVEPGLLEPVSDLVPLTEPVPGDEDLPTDPEEPVDPTEPATPDPGEGDQSPASATPPGPETSDATAGPADPTDPPTEDPGVAAPVDDEQTLLAADLRRTLLERAEGGAGLWSLPVADLDVAALQDAGANAARIAAMLDVGSGTGAPVEGEGTQVEDADADLPDARRDIAWPLTSSYGDTLVTGSAEAWAASTLGDLGGIVLPASTLSSADAASTPDGLSRHTSGVPVLAYDDALSRLVTEGTDPVTHLQARQRLLAESLAVQQEAAPQDRALVLASPRGLRPDPATRAALEEALAQAPWLDFVPADDLLAEASDAPEVSITGPGPTRAPGAGPLTDVPPPALDASLIDRYAAADTGLRTATTVLTRIEERRADWDRFLLEAFSGRWRLAPDAPETMLTRVEETIADVGEGIRIVPTSVNFIADQGVIQVTVVNELEVTVHDIGVIARPSNGRLFVRDEEATPVSIGPGSRANVHLSAQARGAGEVSLESRITAGDGQAIGEPEEILVRVQPLGTWWWWALGLVAAAILVAGVIRAGRARPRADAVPASGSPDDTTDTTDTGDAADTTDTTDTEADEQDTPGPDSPDTTTAEEQA